MEVTIPENRFEAVFEGQTRNGNLVYIVSAGETHPNSWNISGALVRISGCEPKKKISAHVLEMGS